MPVLGGEIQLAILPGSVTGFIRLRTYSRSSNAGSHSDERCSNSDCEISAPECRNSGRRTRWQSGGIRPANSAQRNVMDQDVFVRGTCVVAVYPKSVEDRNIRNPRLTVWDNRT